MSEHNEISQQDDLLLNHEYDGIKEYDNPTPGWWHWIFFGTVVFSIVYFLIVTPSPIFPSEFTVLAQKEEAEFKQRFAALGTIEPDQNTILTIFEWGGAGGLRTVAESLFKQNCASCHGGDGGGLQGPNLTDDSYIHIKQVTDIYDVIYTGRAAGAMPAQGGKMRDNEIILLSAYVAQLRGGYVAGGKAPEGDAVAPWPDEQVPAERRGGGEGVSRNDGGAVTEG